jgi:hypothetical protein
MIQKAWNCTLHQIREKSCSPQSPPFNTEATLDRFTTSESPCSTHEPGSDEMIWADINTLSSFHTRHTKSPLIKKQQNG